MNIKTLTYYLILFTFLCACSSDRTRVMDEIDDSTVSVTSVLFIGNSHTYYNQGLASHLERFGDSFEITIMSDEAAQGGFTLEDHLTSIATLNAINDNDWDFIILQENSYRAAYESEDMHTSITAFTNLLESSNATVLLFQTWAYQDAPEMHSLIQQAYTNASSTSGYPVVRIGQFWKNFIAQYPEVSLYDSDGVHPSAAGTYLTAGFFFKKLFNYPSIIGAYHGTLAEEEANIIQEFVSVTSL